jgi:signal transduction histidine kinase
MRIFVWSFLLLFSRGLFAQEVLLTTTAKSHTVDYPMYLEDKNGIYTLAEVMAAGDRYKRPVYKVPDFLGSFSKAIWFRFNVANHTDTPQWFLEIKDAYMHELTLYGISTSGVADSLLLIADGNFTAKPIYSNNPVFPVTIQPGETKVFYLKASTKTLIRASMSFNTMQHLYEKNMFALYGNGFFSAIAVALLLYNLFVYFSLREKVYLYYIGYIATAILHTNLVAGHVQLFFPWLDWLNTTLILPVVSLFSILFTNSFLRTKKYVPFIFKIRYIITGLCMLPLVFYLLEMYAFAILIVSVTIFLLFAYWLVAGIAAYRKGFQPAIFYVIGFGALVAMSVVFELKMRGVLAESYWTESSLFIGAAIEAVVLSFALASKINFYKKEKELIQQQAYQQAVNFSRELINMQEAERKRIASELHDSLGQKLIVIKNKVFRFTKTSSAGFQQNPEALAASVADAIQEVRSISYGLRPYQIDLLGLTQSIKSLVSETFDAAGIQYTLDIDPVDDINDPEMQINIYRIVQECVNNIVKHARATGATIKVKTVTVGLNIMITDNGTGFEQETVLAGFGLKGIKERLHILNGSIVFAKGEPAGTMITIDIPVKKNDP